MDPATIFMFVLLVAFLVHLVDKRVARSRRAKLDRERGPQPICGCGDHYAFHDPKTGRCHATSKVPNKWDDEGYPVAWKQQQCGCQQYVGPQPLDTYYAPEFTGDTTVRPRLTKGDDTPEES